MKKTKNVSSCLLALLIAACFNLYAQQENVNPAVEKIVLRTDRSLYIAGENVQFAASISSEMQTAWSTVLYAEIITPDGKRAAANKFSIRHSIAYGCLQVPEDIVTGNYYVRAYTKYMRNEGPASYAYVPVKIINPLSNEVLTNSNVIPSPADLVKHDDNEQAAFQIAIEKNEYAPGEKVNVTLSLNNPGNSFMIPLSRGQQSYTSEEPGGGGQNFSVAVVPDFSSSVFEHKLTSADTVGVFRRNLTPDNPATPGIDFYPETRGVSITGQLKDGTNGHPVIGGRVNLSIIGLGRDFEAMQTDSSGRYYFSLPDYTGHRDIFLCAEKDSLTKPILLVDNDFCSIPVHLPAPEFNLSPEERAAATIMARNVRVARYFNLDTVACVNPHETTTTAFYGKPTDVLIFDKFVQLPTLEEYFNELPSAVRVRKQNGHKYFKVIGERAEMNFFNPLVMVDWVAVNNPEKILAASPANIARIEVVTMPYVKGNITYGGIVSIISKKGDFAGIDLPASGIFFNYLFLADSCHCRINEDENPNSPDARNTLYWNPDIEWDANNSASFSFKAAATPGKYDIVIKGVERNGELYEQKTTFLINEK